MSTTREIAEELDLSPSTVAAVLRGKGSERLISEATQRRVEAAAKRMGYAPNALARSLKSGSSNTIGIIGHSLPEYHVLRTREAARTFIDAGYRVAMQDLAWRPEQEAGALAELLGMRVEGLFIESGAGQMGGTDDAYQLLLKQARRKFPMVRLDTTKDLPVDMVGVNREQGVYEATCHLFELGRRNIIFAVDKDNASPPIQARVQGFTRACQVWDTPLRSETFISLQAPPHGDRQKEFAAGYRAAQQALQQSPRPDALLGSNDYVAMGAVAGFLAHGLRVPEDVSVVGCVGYPETCYSSVPLTTVAYPFQAMASMAARMLLERINGYKGRRRTETLTPELVVRASCGGNPDYHPLDIETAGALAMNH